VKLFSTEPAEPGIVAFGAAPIGVLAIGGLPVGVIAIGPMARGLVAVPLGAGAGLVVAGFGVGVGLWARTFGWVFTLKEGSGIFEEGLAVFHDDADGGVVSRAWIGLKLIALVVMLAAAAATGWAQYEAAVEDARIEATLTRRATLRWKGRLARSEHVESPARDCELVADVRTDGKGVVRANVRAVCGSAKVDGGSIDRGCSLSIVPLDRGGRYDLACDSGKTSLATAAKRARVVHTDDDKDDVLELEVEPGAISEVSLINP